MYAKARGCTRAHSSSAQTTGAKGEDLIQEQREGLRQVKPRPQPEALSEVLMGHNCTHLLQMV